MGPKLRPRGTQRHAKRHAPVWLWLARPPAGRAREAAWALCERALRDVCGALPEIAKTPNGKPYALSGDVFFSVSHAKGLVACCVSSEREVGVDAEPLASGARVVKIAEYALTPKEIARLARARHPRDRAAVLWSCKEAYVKAFGTQLGDVDPAKLGFRVTKDRARVDSGGVGVAALRVLVHEEHAVVVAARGSRPFRLRVTK